MAPNLTSGKFRVVSLINDSNPPVGVKLTRPAFQSAHLVVCSGPSSKKATTLIGSV
ncbi:hypothetical protein L210DRAFT_3566764 [Boletus edulis BED1]|uniref:Uncharacterized protein n=1 Tax=Boletus edulis BED1 TaxID=1328754 RepID=A0AAD4BF49_BOLED|nr:hypothetical protein L210DRAFT_3566764 [Boletus edulis BED1]